MATSNPGQQTSPQGDALDPTRVRIDLNASAPTAERATAPRSNSPEHDPAGEQEEEGGEDGVSFEEIKEAAIENAPPWLVSAVVNIALLVTLAVITIPFLGEERITLDASEDFHEVLGDDLLYEDLDGVDVDLPEEPEDDFSLSELPEVPVPIAAPSMMEVSATPNMATSMLESKDPGLALNGRQFGAKPMLRARGGGNASTAEAVQRALVWLRNQQRSDGSWSLTGPYPDGASHDNEIAATAMALLAFQGDGHTTQEGEFREVVVRGWKWLLPKQGPDGCFTAIESRHNHWFYTHGQATIAICELYAMTKDEQYREPAQKAIDYCVAGQSPLGGWRYSPRGDSDVSVTGWIVMAMQSARMAGLNVPDQTLMSVERFLDAASQDGGATYGYRIREAPTRAMTAEAILCRQYLGWKHDDPRMARGVETLLKPENLVAFDKINDHTTNRDVYYWYYATQVLHHLGGERWRAWNFVMRQKMCENQVRSGGTNVKGSWDPNRPVPDQWGGQPMNDGGRLFVTCLSTYMLEVYYRHLPIYYNPFLSDGAPITRVSTPDSTSSPAVPTAPNLLAPLDAMK